MRGAHMANVVAALLERTYTEQRQSGMSSFDALSGIYTCFGLDPLRHRGFDDLAPKVLKSEVNRLKDAIPTVMQSGTTDDLEEMMREPDDAPVPVKFRTDTGFALLPRPIFTRAADGSLGAIRAFVWAPQRTQLITPSGPEPFTGTRLTVYEDAYAFEPEASEEVGIPPLLFRRAELLDNKANWDDIIALRTREPLLAVPKISDQRTPPDGVEVFDDPYGVAHFRALRAFVARSRETDVIHRRSPPARGTSKQRARSRSRRTGVLYIPERIVVTDPVHPESVDPETQASVGQNTVERNTAAADPTAAATEEETGPSFTERGKKRTRTALTAAWPVRPVVREVLNPETGLVEETVVRKGYVLGKRKDEFTYEQLIEDQANGVVHPMPGVTQAVRARLTADARRKQRRQQK